MTNRSTPARLVAAGVAMVAASLGSGTPAGAAPGGPCGGPSNPCLHTLQEVMQWELPPDICLVRVHLSHPVPIPITFRATTVDGTARAGEDYEPVDRPVTIRAGEEFVDIGLQIRPDTRPEETERFWLVISSPSFGSIGNDRTLVTIMDGHRLRSG